MMKHAPESPMVKALRREAALDSTFSRASRIAMGKGVLSFDVNTGTLGGIRSISGLVEGSRGDRYRVHVELDMAEAEIVDYSCTCPAATRYRGMCKHEIALALSYMRGSSETEAARPTAGNSPAAPIPAPPEPTSPVLMGILDEAARKRFAAARRIRAAIGDETRHGKSVSVDVTLCRYYHPLLSTRYRWALRFRMRRGSVSYVVKNISAMVAAWRVGSGFEYGRNLVVEHVPEAFDEASRRVLDEAARVHARIGEVLSSGSDVAFDPFVTQLGGRELPVDEADAAAVLDALTGSSVTLEVRDANRGGARDVSVDVVEGDPRLRIEIASGADASFDLTFPEVPMIFHGTLHTFAFSRGRLWRCGDTFAAAEPLLRKLSAHGPVHIAAADAGAFARCVLPQLAGCCEIVGAEQLEAFAPEPEFTFKVSDDERRVICMTRVRYGQATFELDTPVNVVGDAAALQRDEVAESRVLQVLDRYFTRAHGFDDSDDERLYNLLSKGLKALAKFGDVLLSDRLRSIAVRPTPNLSVRATVKSELLNVELGASGMTPADMIALIDSYKRRERFVRLSDGDILRLDERLRETLDRAAHIADGLDIDLADLAVGADGLSDSRAPFLDAMLRQARGSGLHMRRSAAFKSLLSRFDTLGDKSFEVPSTLCATLRPYQYDGFCWLQTLEHLGAGGILADDMGLGKTLQVVAHVLACREEGASGVTLVVCPASLVYNWASELERFAPTLSVSLVVGDKAARRRTLGSSDDADVLVTSYDLMRIDIDGYVERQFARVIFDEAQYVKNPRTQAAKCARLLRTRVAFALTGTPIENRLGELWSIFDIVAPGLLGSRERFAKRFESPVEHGETEAAFTLQALIGPFVLRRLKEDVLADLSQKTESVVYAHLSGEQERLYRANEDRLALQIAKELPEQFRQRRIQVLAELTKLRQLCCDPRLYYEGYRGESAKLDACMELVSQALEGGHSILLFSQFTSMLELISGRLDAEGIVYLTLTGATSKEDRRTRCEAFQRGEARVFLISLKAGGVGLNLTAADVVVHYDPWWNVAAQNQATDRAHRIGQDRPVTVYRLIASDTVEERILALQDSKRGLADAVLSGTGSAVSLMRRDDILRLLGASIR